MVLLFRKTHQCFHEEGSQQGRIQNREVGTKGDNWLWEQSNTNFKFSMGGLRIPQIGARELKGERSQEGEEGNCKMVAPGDLDERRPEWMPSEGNQPEHCRKFNL